MTGPLAAIMMWGGFEDKRSVIHLVELKYVNVAIVCDRDEQVNIKLQSNKK